MAGKKDYFPWVFCPLFILISVAAYLNLSDFFFFFSLS